VFIVVCRDTRLAKLVYGWLTGETAGAPPPVEEFRNTQGREHTIRVDSRVVEDLATGAPRSDESRRLRFVLATIGKTEWPDRRPPTEWLDLVDKLNRRAVEEGRPAIDAGIPPGRDVRCIVSVAMLTEGWDATTVTHIVGLRPFQSQLLCEQVVGRGLRRSQYHDLSVEEVAKVYGVPFELIPLKATPGTPTPPPKIHHVRAVSPERDALEIRFPRVEGYVHRPSARIDANWDRVPRMTLDPMEIPDEVRVKGLSAEQGGRLSLFGPGALSEVSLDSWRNAHRMQELQFDMARYLTAVHVERWGDVPAQVLFPQMLAIVKRFVDQKVDPAGRRQRKDVFLEPYFTWAAEALLNALAPADEDAPELPRYEAHRGAGSTRDVDFWTSRPVWETTRSHVNYVVADTDKWEQSAAFYLDTDDRVITYVKNANLGFAIPYTFRGTAREYLPDFLVRLRYQGAEIGTLLLETKGYDPAERSKVEAAHRWVAAVNADGSYGRWVYRLVSTPSDVPRVVAPAITELMAPRSPGWRVALRRFTDDVRALYGDRVESIVLYGSRARGDATHDSDVDVVVVLKDCHDTHAELKRMAPAADRALLDYDVVLCAMPVDAQEYSEGRTPFLMNVRREGVSAP
jgi:type III restriction enzyme